MTTPAARSEAATLDHGRWCSDEMPDAEFIIRTMSRMAELRESEFAQAAGENILLLNTERILAELSEALSEYVTDRPRGSRESEAGAERVALLREAARLIQAAVKA